MNIKRWTYIFKYCDANKILITKFDKYSFKRKLWANLSYKDSYLKRLANVKESVMPTHQIFP